MPYEKDPNEIGALWLKRGAKGLYMTGKINGEPVVCFPAKGGEGDRIPAWNVKRPMAREE